MVLVIMWISLGARHLNIFKNSFNKPYKYEIYSIPDDRIIFLVLHFIECFIQCLILHPMFHSKFSRVYKDSNPSKTHTIHIFVSVSFFSINRSL